MDSIVQDRLESHQRWLADSSTGVRCRLPSFDLTGMDFTGYSLAQADLRHANLTNCIMPADCQDAIFSATRGSNVDWSNSDITNTNFDTADISGFHFIGASWNGLTITSDPIQIIDTFWTMFTNAFLQIGCKQQTFGDWSNMTDDDRRALLLNSQYEPQEAVDWWNRNLSQITAIHQQLNP